MIRQMHDKFREYPLPEGYRGSYEEMRKLTKSDG